jgi:hypothetical protein
MSRRGFWHHHKQEQSHSPFFVDLVAGKGSEEVYGESVCTVVHEFPFYIVPLWQKRGGEVVNKKSIC